MPDVRLAVLATQIETLKARLAKTEETRERLLVLREMRQVLQEADQIIKGHIEDFVEATVATNR
jgi:hypothetical protein